MTTSKLRPPESARPQALREGKRLGVYQDGPFSTVVLDGLVRLAPDPVDAPFLQFVSAVADHFDSLTVFGRIVGSDDDANRPLMPPRTRVVALPDYGSLRRLGALARAAARTAASFWRGLAEVDVVWAFGPQPFELLLVLLGLARRKRVVLGVRQDTRVYYRTRLPSSRWRPLLVVVAGMDDIHRLLARRLSATVVGEDNARRYGGGKGRVLDMRPTLIRGADVISEPLERDWEGVVDLLAVGRIDPEKNPLVLVDALAALNRASPDGFRLRWAGVGPLEEAVRRRADELGISRSIEFLGYVPFGPALLALYRSAHVFVHVSLTEGVPQVLVEALASGTPIVATDVGSVRSGLDGGAAGLLVQPGDASALAEAVRKLADDPELRRRLVARGLDLARSRTTEAEAARVAKFLFEA